jgi:hypothetical protein
MKRIIPVVALFTLALIFVPTVQANAATVTTYGSGPSISTITKPQQKQLIKCIESKKLTSSACEKIHYPQVSKEDISVGWNWGGLQITIDQLDAATWWFGVVLGLGAAATNWLISTLGGLGSLAGGVLSAIFLIYGAIMTYYLSSAATHQTLVPCGFDPYCPLQYLWPNWPLLPFKGDGVTIEIGWLGSVTFGYITGYGNPNWPVCPCQPNQP